MGPTPKRNRPYQRAALGHRCEGDPTATRPSPRRALALGGETALLLLAIILLSAAGFLQSMTDGQGRLQIDDADFADWARSTVSIRFVSAARGAIAQV